MPLYKTKAIIIKRRNMGESDRVLTLFSPDFGKFNTIAKGSRKSKSKLSAGVELFTEANFILSNGKSFEIVTEVSPISHNLSEEKDIESIKLAHFFAEVITHVTVEKQASPVLYDTLAYCLTNIDKIDHRLILIYFTSHVLGVSGSYPELSECLNCQNKPAGEIYFSHTAGGIFCVDCKPITESLINIDRDIIKLWRFIMESNTNKLERLKISDTELLNSTYSLALTFLCNITGKEYCTINSLRLTK